MPKTGNDGTNLNGIVGGITGAIILILIVVIVILIIIFVRQKRSRYDQQMDQTQSKSGIEQ